MTTQMPDAALAEYVAECEEILHRVSNNLGVIERAENGIVEPAVIDALYRDMHTIKGTSQLFGFQEISKIAHALEASFDPLRRRQKPLHPRLAQAAAKALDAIERMVKAINQKQGQENFKEETAAVLPRLIDAATAQFDAEITPEKQLLIENDVRRSSPKDMKPNDSPTLPSSTPSAAPSATPASTVSAPVENTEPTPVLPSTAAGAVVQTQGAGTAAAQVSNAVANPASSAQSAGTPIDTTVRVQVTLLDRLMNLVGELVLVRNQMLQYQNRHDVLEFVNLSNSLDVVTSELQSDVMKTRMQPIGNVVTKFQRVVRDLARDLGKKIDLTLEGMETELDKTLLEAIKDPLTHIVRNSCDHGIEDVEGRRKANKPESGHLLIRAFHEGGQVVVEVSDDGKGLDPIRIKEKAVEKGLMTAESAANLSEREVHNIIFLPGFSTAKAVTSVSGRGVGMDVVKTNIEKIGGTVEVASVFKKGTAIRLKIPLTLAIVPAMLVRLGSEKFAIPQVKLVELVFVENDSASDRIEYLQGMPMYRLRGNLLPLVSLNAVLGTRQDEKRNGTNIVVLNAEGELFGLMVDEILDTADIVVKPLSPLLKALSVFSGATILGDGGVALILDVVGIAEKSQINTKKQKGDASRFFAGEMRKSVNYDTQEFLFFSVWGSPAKHSIPLCLVSRLEEFEQNRVERTGDLRVVQYRGSLLPLFSLDKILNYQVTPVDDKNNDHCRCVVVERSGKRYGIEVKEILDIATIDDQIDDSVRDNPGILGNIVYNNEVVVVVDALGVIERELGKLQPASGGIRGIIAGNTVSTDAIDSKTAIDEIKSRSRLMKSKRVRILFAEDVPFFRKHVNQVLTGAGYEVTVVEDGARALEELNASTEGQYNILLSDIEMPKMTGLQLAEEVRKIARFKDLPLIALTTRFNKKDIQRGTEAGFNMYLEKLNADVLLNSIESVLGNNKTTEKIG